MCAVLCWVTCGCVFPACYIVSGVKSEVVFKMAARVSSTSSEEMASSSEDSATEDPVNIAKGRGIDLKEPAIHHSEHKCEYDCHQICKYFQIMFCLLTSLNDK